MVRPPAIDICAIDSTSDSMTHRISPAADSDDDPIQGTKWHRHSEHIVALLLLFVDDDG